MKDISDALEVWSKYWPVLKTDQVALQLEKKINHAVEYRKHIFGSKHPDRVNFNPEMGMFSKQHKHHVEVDLWYKFKDLENDEEALYEDLFPEVVGIEENNIMTKDYRKDGKIPWRFLKIVLEPPHKTRVSSHEIESDSQESTDNENAEYFEHFYLKFAFKLDDGNDAGKMSFILRKGSAFDFKERNIKRLKDHIDIKHKESLIN